LWIVVGMGVSASQYARHFMDRETIRVSNGKFRQAPATKG